MTRTSTNTADSKTRSRPSKTGLTTTFDITINFYREEMKQWCSGNKKFKVGKLYAQQ